MASVKLFELGVRTPGGLFLGVWYAGVLIFGVSYTKHSDFRRNFRSTRSDELHGVQKQHSSKYARVYIGY